MQDIEYTIPVAITAGLSINLEPDEQITRAHFDRAMDALQERWNDGAIDAGIGSLYATILGPEFGSWRGEVYDRNTGTESPFDLRTDFERWAEGEFPDADWRQEVANGDTMLGFREWLQHKVDSARQDDRKIGRQYRFAYPVELTTLPDYTAHAGQVVTVVRQLTKDEADQEFMPMWEVRAADGWIGHADSAELVAVEG